jgi:GntR family transcriptional regulator
MVLESGRPRHEQISDWLRERIEEGHYEVDAKLPSEKQLGARFDVSRVTVRRALQTLEHEGYIYRRQGLGSFVQERRAPQGLVRLTDFAQDMAQAGLEASSKVVHHTTETPPPEVALRLDLDADTPATRLDRLRLGDNIPIAFDRTWLPLFYGQFLQNHDLERETIYGILEEDYGIPVLRGRYRIAAANARDDLATHLGVPDGRALLLIERLSLTEHDTCVYFQRRYYRSDRVAYELELARDPNAAHSDTSGMPLRDFEPVFDTDA